MTLYALGAHQPQLHADTWVAPDANLVGQVVLEAGASVWFGCTIRADHEEIRICEGANVQENVVMHIDAGFPLTVGKNCTIGHKVMLHGCTIGENSLIGMGATVLNGAKIGKNCLIGAGALITEGKDIPDQRPALSRKHAPFSGRDAPHLSRFPQNSESHASRSYCAATACHMTFTFAC